MWRSCKSRELLTHNSNWQRGWTGPTSRQRICGDYERLKVSGTGRNIRKLFLKLEFNLHRVDSYVSCFSNWFACYINLEIWKEVVACQTELKNANKTKCSILISFHDDLCTLQYLDFTRELCHWEIYFRRRGISKVLDSQFWYKTFLFVEKTRQEFFAKRLTKSRKSQNYSESTEKDKKKAPISKTWQTTYKLSA